MSRLLEQYRKQIVPALEKEFSYGNPHGESHNCARSSSTWEWERRLRTSS